MPAEAPLSDLLIVVTTVIFIIEVYILLVVHRLKDAVGDGDGSKLIRIVWRFGWAILLSQALSVVRAVMFERDIAGTTDSRLLLFFVGEVVVALFLIWAVVEVRDLPVDLNPDGSHGPGGKEGEGVGKEVDNALSTTPTPTGTSETTARPSMG